MTPHSPSGSPDEASDPQPEHRRPTRRERQKICKRVRALTHAINTMDLTLTPQRHPPTPAPSEREQIQALLRLYRRARASPQVSNNPQSSLVTLLIVMLSLASSTQAIKPPLKTPPSPLLLFLAPLFSPALSSPSHQPFNWTVHIMGEIEKDLLYNVTARAPSFTANVCKFVQFTGLNNNNWLRNQCQGNLISGFYICPSTGRGCADPSHFYCPSWGCETIAYGWSGAPNRDQHLQVSWEESSWKGITLTVKNPNEDNWFSGRMYGLRLYMEGYDWGVLFSIQKRHPTATNLSGVGPNKILNPPNPRPSSSTSAVGPNQVLNPPQAQPPSPPRSASPSPSPDTSLTTAPLGSHNPKPRLPPSQYSSPLINLIKASYASLNTSHPNLTASCWLCLSPSLPLYEPVATNLTFSESSENSPTGCNWNASSVPLTFQSVSSTGRCVHSRQGSHPLLDVCSSYSSPNASAKFLIPHNTSQWLCTSTGLTPCLNVATLNATNETCLLILLAPRVLFHSDEGFFSSLQSQKFPTHLQKREPITVLTVATLLSLARAGTGIAALAAQSSSLSSLRRAVDKDITHLQTAISHLKNSLNSLYEVVLQNRRDLDLLLLKEGGLCAALGEECCIYANSTGLAEDSLKKVREGLERRQREREAAHYSSGIFHTLLPYLLPFLGPLIIIILALTIGPWAVRRTVQLAKDQVNAVFTSFVQVHYQRLATEDSPPVRSRPACPRKKRPNIQLTPA